MVRISRSFIKGSILYTIIGALPMASAVLLLPFYMNHLSTSLFGALSIYLAFSLLIQLLVTYSYDTALYVHYHEFKTDKSKLSIFISSSFSLMLLIGIGLFGIIAITGPYIFSWLFSDIGVSFFPNGWLAMVGGICQAIFKVHSSLLQTREKRESFFWSNLVLFICIALFTILGLELFPSSLMGPLGGRALALMLASVWIIYRVYSEFGFHLSFKTLGESFDFNLYSFIYQLQQWIINYFDRILMVFFLPLSSVGEYDFVAKCLIGIELFMNGLHNSFFPKVVKEVVGQSSKGTSIGINRYYNGLVASIMIVISVSILLLPLLIDFFSEYLGRNDYKASIPLIPYLAVLYMLRAIRLFFIFPYGVLKHTKPLPPIYLVTASLKIATILLLIPYLGVQSLIIATAISLIAEIALLYMRLKKFFLIKFNVNKIIVAPLLLLSLIFVTEYWIIDASNLVIHLFYLVSCFVILFLGYKNEIKAINVFKILK
jgi:O-antigen/teichoic acid export membrane protein